MNVSYCPYQFEGLPKNSNYDELSGSDVADPVIQPAVQVGWYSLSLAVQQSQFVLVSIEYSVEFYRPKTMGDI